MLTRPALIKIDIFCQKSSCKCLVCLEMTWCRVLLVSHLVYTLVQTHQPVLAHQSTFGSRFTFDAVPRTRLQEQGGNKNRDRGDGEDKERLINKLTLKCQGRRKKIRRFQGLWGFARTLFLLKETWGLGSPTLAEKSDFPCLREVGNYRCFCMRQNV